MQTLIERLDAIDGDAAAKLRAAVWDYTQANQQCQMTTGQLEYPYWQKRRDKIAGELFAELGWLPRAWWIATTGRQPISSAANISEQLEPIND